LEADNAKLRAEVERLAESNVKLCAQVERLLAVLEERDVLKLQNGAWEKLVRAAADQLYALGKHLRGEDAATGITLQVVSTELHRECQVIKGEDPLPHAGGRLTEKQKGPSGGHVDGPDRPDRTDHPCHR
jgi:hypothetical protein